LIYGHFDNFIPLARELLAQLARRGMFDGGRDDALALRPREENASNRGVDRFGAAAGEQQLAVGASHQCRDLCPRLVDCLTRALAEAVDARRVAVQLSEVRQHRRQHIGRGLGGGVVVEINQVHRSRRS
jgi:hypothetical protein